MFSLNTILAWNINFIMNKKYDNNNIIIASRAYFFQGRQADAGGRRGGAGDGKEKRAQQENTGEEGGNGLEPLSARSGTDKEGGARGRARCPGQRISDPNLRPE
jgi:hypothetical protein